MREVYKKNELLTALLDTLENSEYSFLLISKLLKIKIQRLDSEYKELDRQYKAGDYESIILRNRDKEIKDYDVPTVQVSIINKVTKKLNTVIKSINFYQSLIEETTNKGLSQKRLQSILKLVKKSFD